MKLLSVKTNHAFLKQTTISVLGLKLSFRQKLNPVVVLREAEKNWEKIFEQLNNNEQIVLVFDHGLGGGTQTYFYDLAASLDNHVLRIQFHHKKSFYKVTFFYNKNEICLFENSIENLFNKLKEFEIETTIINNLVGYKSIKEILSFIDELQRLKQFKLIMMIHDYYCICPTWTFVHNVSNKYCNYKFNQKECCECAKKLKIKSIEADDDFNIFEWQTLWKDFLTNCDEIRTFCQATQDIVKDVYPELSEKVTVVPHKIQPFKKRIGIIGNIGTVKGHGIIKEFLEYLDKNRINDVQLVVIGKVHPNIKDKNLIVLGEYKRDLLRYILKENYIDMVFIPSITPETFSYTTAEAISLGYPVMCFDLGGQAEQVKKYSKGIITSQNMDDIYRNIVELANDK